MEQPVKVVGDRVVRFADVAKIRRTYKDPTSIARINGRHAVSLEVKNVLAKILIRSIKLKVVNEAKTIWPEHTS